MIADVITLVAPDRGATYLLATVYLSFVNNMSLKCGQPELKMKSNQKPKFTNVIPMFLGSSMNMYVH